MLSMYAYQGRTSDPDRVIFGDLDDEVRHTLGWMTIYQGVSYILHTEDDGSIWLGQYQDNEDGDADFVESLRYNNLREFIEDNEYIA